MSRYPCMKCFCHWRDLGVLASRPRKRSQQWVTDSADGSLKLFDIDDGSVPDLLQRISGKRHKGGLIVERARELQHSLRGIRDGDRIEPAPG
eukprot:725612-Pyramimonas_sp.AAC.1